MTLNIDSFNHFVAIDLETTGLDKNKDKIIEIALCRFTDGQPGETFSQVINPNKSIRSFILNLTKLDPNEIAAAPQANEVLQEALDFIGDSPLVAHNAEVDRHFLKKELEENGFLGFNNVFWDSLFISRLAWTNTPNHRLETLVRFLKLDPINAHRALPDAIQCGHVFAQGIKIISELSSEVKTSLAWLAKSTYYEELFPNSPEEAPLIPPVKQVSEPNEESPKNEIKSWNDFYSLNGPISQSKENYEIREQQADISQIVSETQETKKVSFIEAPTGSGKTLAYLSAAFKTISEKKESVVIGTATKTLQDQIIQNEIPLLKQHFPHVKVSALKGKENYLCRRKLQDLINTANAHLTKQDRTHVMTLIPWVASTLTGDINENSSFHSSRCQHIWRLINGESSSCNSSICNNHKCYAENTYEQAKEADLLIVNHSLLIKDAQFNFSVLPKWDHLIVDEAHRFSHNAHQQLGKQLWFYRFRALLHRLNNAQVEQPLILSISNQLDPSSEIQQVAFELQGLLKDAEKGFHKLLMKIGRRLKNERAEFYTYNEPLATRLNLPVEEFLTQVETLLERSEEFLSKAPLSVEHLISPLAPFNRELKTFLKDFRFLFEAKNNTKNAYWLTDWGNPHLLRIHSKPIEISDFSESILNTAKSVTFTSATLTIKDDFSFMANALGLRKSEILPHQITSPWPVEKMRKVVIVDFLPSPTEANYQTELDKLLTQILPDQKGSTLCLYTSIKSLKNTHKQISEPMIEANKFLLGQHIDGTIENLTGLFKQNIGSTLLGTQIFWEGVDLPGEQLSNLFITKLPFPSPYAPLIQAQSEIIKSNGKNPFKEIFVPEALMNLKQGMGRLLRHPKDSGTIVLFDNRILTQPYGKSFKRLWKNNHIQVSNLKELKEVLHEN